MVIDVKSVQPQKALSIIEVTVYVLPAVIVRGIFISVKEESAQATETASQFKTL